MALPAATGSPEPSRRWSITLTAETERWYRGLGPNDKARIASAFDGLREHGPAAHRPRVGAIKGSRHHNMKELRLGSKRVLFAFDNKREAVMLLGGDKRGKWKSWYAKAIPKADRLYDQHLRDTGKEGAWRHAQRDRGRSSGGRSR